MVMLIDLRSGLSSGKITEELLHAAANEIESLRDRIHEVISQRDAKQVEIKNLVAALTSAQELNSALLRTLK